MSTPEAAAYIGIAVRTLGKLKAARRLKGVHVGRRLIYKRTELDRFVDLLAAQAA